MLGVPRCPVREDGPAGDEAIEGCLGLGARALRCVRVGLGLHQLPADGTVHLAVVPFQLREVGVAVPAIENDGRAVPGTCLHLFGYRSD